MLADNKGNNLSSPRTSIISDIIRSKRRNQLVIAAAGSGKTRLLLDVLVGKIECGDIDLTKEEVIVFTFTNDAADELAVRLTKKLEAQQTLLNRIFVGTIHGWCSNYLQKKGTLANTKIIDELEQYQLLLRIYPILSIKDAYDGVNKFRKIETFVNDLELFYNENLDISDDIIPEKIRVCLSEYFDFISDQRLLDFGSLIRNAVSLIRSKKEKTKYHVFVDEYQDVNLAQVRLFQSLLSLHPESTLFAVGDPRQAIYQWRGSDIRRILGFSSDFEDAQIFSRAMQRNYRSRTGIIEFANAIAKDMDFSSYVEPHIEIEDMVPVRTDEAISVTHETANLPHEEQIVHHIEELHERGVQYSDIAVLMRSVVYYASPLMDLLGSRGIPYYSPNKNAGIIFIQEFMGSIIKLMEFMAEDREPANRQEEEELEEEIDSGLKSILKYCNDVRAHDIHVAVERWYNKLTTPIRRRKAISGASGHVRYRNQAYNFRRQLFDFCKEINFSINEDEVELQEGFSATTQIMRAIEEVYRRRFKGASIRAPPIEVFLRNLKWQLDHEIERWAETGMEMAGGGDRVTISTVHAAKGLEWPVVLVPFLWANRFPVRKSGHGTSFPDEIAWRYGTTREDEKRLWYVAVTRARDRVYYFSGSVSQRRKRSPFTYSDVVANSPYTIETQSLSGNENLSEIESISREIYLKLGVSDFLLLLECPYHFYLRRVKGFDVPVGEEFGAGNVLHKAIERILKEGDKADLKTIIDEEVYLPLAEYFFEEKIRKKTENRIQSLVESGDLSGVELSEIPFKLLIGNMTVVGIIDAIRRTQKGIEIIDWKSSIHDRFKNRYENQIRIYAAGLRSMGYNVQKGLIYNIDKIQKDPKNRVLEVDVSKEKIRQLLERVETTLMSLENEPPSTEPSQVSCNVCDVHAICRNPYIQQKDPY